MLLTFTLTLLTPGLSCLSTHLSPFRLHPHPTPLWPLASPACRHSYMVSRHQGRWWRRLTRQWSSLPLLVLWRGEGGHDPPPPQVFKRKAIPYYLLPSTRKAPVITSRAKLLATAKIEALARRKEMKNKVPSTESASPRAATTNKRGDYGEGPGPSSSTHGLVYMIHSLFIAVIGFSVFYSAPAWCMRMFLQHSPW